MRTLLRLWCRIFGHRWEQWTDAGDERCGRCLDWKAGASPMQFEMERVYREEDPTVHDPGALPDDHER